MSESEAWRMVTAIATGIDRIDAHLSRLEASVSELDAAVARLAAAHPPAGRPGREDRMEESEGVPGDAGLAFRVGGLLEESGVPDALAIAVVVALYRDHPQWAVWLPAPGGAWVAARPAGPQPPGPDVPMVWVGAGTASELGARMGQADASLAPG